MMLAYICQSGPNDKADNMVSKTSPCKHGLFANIARVPLDKCVRMLALAALSKYFVSLIYEISDLDSSNRNVF